MLLGFTLLFAVPVLGLDFFMFSDPHYDIFYNPLGTTANHCSAVDSASGSFYAKFGCDSSLELLQSALSKAAAVNPDPDFLVLAGDLLSHFSDGLTTQEKLTTFEKVAQAFIHQFPNTQLIFTLGNNDGFQDYQLPSEESKPLNEFMAMIWAPIAGDLPSSFLTSGYYAVQTRTGHKTIVLNTNYLSIRVQHDFQAASQQFSWLESELQSLAPGQRAILIMHIPPGPGMFKGISYDWHACYIDRFVDILRLYESQVELVLAGHQHKAGFQIVPKSGLGVLVTQALSPIFRNNPGFRRYKVSDEKADYEDYYLDLNADVPEWEVHFQYSEFFGEMKKFDFERMYEHLIAEDNDNLYGFISRAHGLDTSSLSPASLWEIAVSLDTEAIMRRTALCAYKYISNFDYELCKWGVNSIA